MLYENKLFMKQTLTLFALIFSCSLNYAQISSGKTEAPKEKSTRVKVKDTVRVGLNENWFFLGGGYQLTSMRLKENPSVFGKPLGERINEKAVNGFTVQMGIRNRFHKFGAIEGGVILDRYAESYDYASSTSDSTYRYTRHYNYIAIPIQVYFTYGKRLQFFVGGGIQPGIPIQMKLATTYTDSLGNETSIKSKKKEALNPFSLSLLGSIGLNFQITNQFGMYFIPSYSYGLTNIYNKQQPHQEWLSGLNFKLGITFLPNGWSLKRKSKKV